MQPPRELQKALKFAIEINTPARRQRLIEKTIRRYLAHKQKEPGKWMRIAVRHRASLKALYAMTHCPTPEWVSEILFKGKYAPGSIFADISNLSKMEPKAAAAAKAPRPIQVTSRSRGGERQRPRSSGNRARLAASNIAA